MRIAITGHRGLPDATEQLVDRALRGELARDSTGNSLIGISCLADGADQIFARAVLDVGGQLDVIIPAIRYRDGLPGTAQTNYDRLLSRLRKSTASTTPNRADRRIGREPVWRPETIRRWHSRRPRQLRDTD
jgi:hypothetical protein